MCVQCVKLTRNIMDALVLSVLYPSTLTKQFLPDQKCRPFSSCVFSHSLSISVGMRCVKIVQMSKISGEKSPLDEIHFPRHETLSRSNLCVYVASFNVRFVSDKRLNMECGKI